MAGKSIKWTDEEIELLKDNCSNKDVLELSYILNKSQEQIWRKIYKLNLKCKKIDKSEYHNLNEVFIDYKRLLNNEIKKFKKDYNIKYDTILFKYYLKINDINITKDFVYNIYFSKLLKDAKLYSRIKKKWHSCFEFITKCFPEMKLKEYNFKTLQVREGFWDKDYNCFENIKEGINNALKDKIIEDKKEILLFDKDTMQKYFHKSMLYFRGVCILEKFLSFYNIKHDKLNYYNNIRFDSFEELKLYKYINTLILILKNNKIMFNNNLVRYKPDFFIYFNNKIIIIEYFGMFKEKPHNQTYQTYKDKTIAKIKYYNKLDNYLFIDFYPNDLKNNFKGVRDKLTSFFMSNFNVDINTLKGGDIVDKTVS